MCTNIVTELVYHSITACNFFFFLSDDISMEKNLERRLYRYLVQNLIHNLDLSRFDPQKSTLLFITINSLSEKPMSLKVHPPPQLHSLNVISHKLLICPSRVNKLQ